MRFAKEPPTHLLTGDHVLAEGDLSNNTLVLYSGSNVKAGGNGGTTSTSTSSTSGVLPYTFGTQYTLAILVNFQDDVVQPYTVTDAQAMFSGQINDFFMENSYKQTSISATVVGWYTIPESVSTCNLSQIASDAQNAAVAAGVNLTDFTRYVYVFPPDSACGFAGSSYVGGNPSQSWINGSLTVHVIDHELGHAFGLWHSHSLDCGTSATTCSSGTVVEYGDVLDTMGQPQAPSPHYNSFQKERLGWLNFGVSPSIGTVTTSGTYTINTYELEGTGPTALKILKSTDPTTGAKTWYYLEARQSAGFDAFLTNGTCFTCGTQNETSGILFHIGTDSDGNSSDVLDMTPATPTAGGWFDQSLVVGQSFQDSTAGVTFTPITVDSTGATVQITITGSSTSSGPLSTSVTTNQSSYLPGQTVTLTVTELSGTTPAAGVSVSATVMSPSGKSTTLTGTTGNTGAVQINYKLPRRAAAGTYQVGAAPSASTTTLAAATASATTTFSVQ